MPQSATPKRQGDFVAAFLPLLQPARYKAVYGGRGSGKSHAIATALIGLANKKPLRVLCAREIQKSIRESVKRLLDDKIDQMNLRDRFESTQQEIRGPNGSLFVFTGLSDETADTLKSYEGVDVCWVEEAQTITDRSLEILRPTIRKPGSEIWLSWNPRHQTDAVDKFFRGAAPPDDAWIARVNWDDNPFFPEELEKERQHDFRHNPERYAHVWQGEYEPAVTGAIWDMATINAHRRAEPPPLSRIVVSVDPAVSSEAGSNEHGVIVAGLGNDNRAYVIEDGTLAGKPDQWSRRVVALFDKHEADAIVIETNQGGDLCEHTLRAQRPGLPIIRVHASRGKHVRAEPIAAQYALGAVSHIGAFPDLERQMCQMTAAGYEGQGSPDRADALVWAMTELFPQGQARESGWNKPLDYAPMDRMIV